MWPELEYKKTLNNILHIRGLQPGTKWLFSFHRFRATHFISASKSSCVVFTLRNQPVPRIVNPLHINSRPIPENSSHVFLGITLDSRLTYRLHSIKTQTRGHRRLNVLRALSGTKWGGDRQTSFLLYKSLIRSVLEYNSFLFTHIASSYQRRIETIQNTALRIITGAFWTTPVNSLLAETNTLPLSMRSHASLFKYFVKTKRKEPPSQYMFLYDAIRLTLDCIPAIPSGWGPNTSAVWQVSLWFP